MNPAENPSRILSPEQVAELRAAPGCAMICIAGRDSVAAAVAGVRSRDFSHVLPTIVSTGTEYGDANAPLAAVARMTELLGETTRVLPAVRFGSPRLWAALNGRFAAVLAKRYGVFSACLACHLYVHLVRVPLAWSAGNAPVITGERDDHDGGVKLSQTPASIDAETRVLAYGDVELIAPVRHESTAEVDALVEGRWPRAADGLECVHSGNYRALNGAVTYDEIGYARYLSEFFEPVGRAVIDAWRNQPSPDYEALVAGVLGST